MASRFGVDGMQEPGWPPSNLDFDFFYAGISARQLLAQRCISCRKVRFPPGPMCPDCRSLQWEAQRCTGMGTVHSYTIMYRPVMAPFKSPHTVVVVELQEGFRLAGVFTGTSVRIGLPVAIEYVEGDNGVIHPGFCEAS